MPKKGGGGLGQFADFRQGAWQERGCDVFEGGGVDTPMHTMSPSVCFFNIAIFPLSFSNTKSIQISLESLMIELYSYIKNYLDYFPGRLK